MDFRIFDAADHRDRIAWIELWREWPKREVFAHPDYVRLYATPHAKALCVAARENGGCVLYPFLLREIGSEPWCHPSLGRYTDIATAYGYGGPFRWGTVWDSDTVERFWQKFDNWATAVNAISETIRLSLTPSDLLDYPGKRLVVSDNVVVTLKPEDELWRTFEHKVRKNVNRARSSGVTIRLDEGGDLLERFLSIYTATMDRRDAAKTYYFPRGYFESIRSELNGQSAWFHAFVADTLVSSELVLVSSTRIYSFLGGTDASWFHLRPNDLLKVEIMNWAHAAGKKEFVLGGGYTRGDGIYRYKLSFAPSGAVPFSIGSRILDSAACERLVQSRHAFSAERGVSWHPHPNYFPPYRA